MSENVNIASAKPFPWKCRHCGEVAVRPDTISYPVKVEHDGRLYQFTVDGLKTPVCSHCKTVFPDAEANRQISQAFRSHAKLLTPQQIRANREALRLTQKQFAAALRIAEATVSRWETCAQIQQGSLDGLMRLFFEHPEVREVLMNEEELSRVGVVARFGPCSAGHGGSVPSGAGGLSEEAAASADSA